MKLHDEIMQMKGDLFKLAPATLCEAAERQAEMSFKPIQVAAAHPDIGVRAVAVMTAFALTAHLVALLEEMENPL